MKRTEEKRAERKAEIQKAEARAAKSPEQLAREEIGKWRKWQGNSFKTFSEDEFSAFLRDERQRERTAAEIHKLRARDRRLTKADQTRLHHLKEQLGFADDEQPESR